MKEDYLWDKTGAADAEIAGLENALKTFRYTETAPPALPAKVLTVEKEKTRWFFRFRFAFAAFAAAVVIFAVVWLQIPHNKMPVAATLAETVVPKRPEKIAGDSFIETPAAKPAKMVEKTPREIKPNVVKARQMLAPPVRQNKMPARNNKIKEFKEPAETLTAEEKYAYDQLMLALSITGSKLKIVKDKIDRIEDQNAVLETAR